MGERYVKEWLRDEVEDFVAGSCGALLESVRPSAHLPLLCFPFRLVG